MNISVVIPVFNAEKTIGQCLTSVYEQSQKPTEIIVADNNSTDGTKEIVLKFIIKYNDIPIFCLDEIRQGPSFARNSGAKNARGDIIAFIDADCIADSSWLRRLSESFGRADVGAAAGSAIGFDKDTLVGKFHALFTLKGFQQSRIFNAFNLVSGGFPTANFSVRKEIFISLNGFDESFTFFAEDYDLCARIYELGSNIYYNKDAIVFHQHRQDLLSTWRQSYGFGTGHAALLKKHFRRMVLIEAPRFRYISKRWPLRMWLDIASADKKFILCLILSGIWSPFSLVLILYLVLLYRDMGGRAKKEHIEADFGEKWGMVLLLLFKSMAMTCGKLRGSFTHGVLCI